MKTSRPRIFKFVSELNIRRDHFDWTNHQSLTYRAKLPKSIYWIQPTERGKILWNITLLSDLLINGDRAEHQNLIEEYYSTLPIAA
jgi:hypothetical protein